MAVSSIYNVAAGVEGLLLTAHGGRAQGGAREKSVGEGISESGALPGRQSDVIVDISSASPPEDSPEGSPEGSPESADTKRGEGDSVGGGGVSEGGAAAGAGLTEEEQKQVEDLKNRDREVRRHEQAHKAAAGQYARGGPVYEYQQGPDGKRYAVGGHVSIDTSPVRGDSEATIQKMEQVRRAANAPAEPSAQDQAVAARAAEQSQQARSELREEQAGGGGQESGAESIDEGGVEEVAGREGGGGERESDRGGGAVAESGRFERRGVLVDLYG